MDAAPAALDAAVEAHIGHPLGVGTFLGAGVFADAVAGAGPRPDLYPGDPQFVAHVFRQPRASGQVLKWDTYSSSPSRGSTTSARGT